MAHEWMKRVRHLKTEIRDTEGREGILDNQLDEHDKGEE